MVANYPKSALAAFLTDESMVADYILTKPPPMIELLSLDFFSVPNILTGDAFDLGLIDGDLYKGEIWVGESKLIF